MDNVVSIFSKQEPCRYMMVENIEFISSYMNDVLHSFNCLDCQNRYKAYMRSSAKKLESIIMEQGKIIVTGDLNVD